MYFSGRVDEAMSRNELALDIAEALQLPYVLSHGLNTKGIAYVRRGRRNEGMLLVRHALDVALSHDLVEPAVRGYINLTAVTAEHDRLREGLELGRAGADLARKIGDRQAERMLESWVIGLLVGLGEWDDAIVRQEAIDPTWPVVDPFLHRGQREEVDRQLEGMRDRSDPNETQHVAGLRSLEAYVLATEGKMAEALAAAEEVLALRDELGLTEGSFTLALEQALAAAFALGDRAKADELLGIVETLPPGALTSLLRAIGARFGARRAALDGDAATAHAAFLAAADVFREMETPFDLAVVLLEHGEWLSSNGRAAEAEPVLDEARATFERLRATPWLERLDRARVAPAEPEPAAVD
jgi:tetratricopeptide (TPR) repeat protein